MDGHLDVRHSILRQVSIDLEITELQCTGRDQSQSIIDKVMKSVQLEGNRSPFYRGSLLSNLSRFATALLI